MQRSFASFGRQLSGWVRAKRTLLILQVSLDPLLDAQAALVLAVEANAKSLVWFPPADLGPHPDARQSQQSERDLQLHSDRNFLGALDRHPTRTDLFAGRREAPVVARYHGN